MFNINLYKNSVLCSKLRLETAHKLSIEVYFPMLKVMLGWWLVAVRVSRHHDYDNILSRRIQTGGDGTDI